MIRILFITLLSVVFLQANDIGKKIAILVIDNNTLVYNNSTKSEFQEIVKKQKKYYSDLESIQFIVGGGKALQESYARFGTKALANYAAKNALSSIAVVEYKKTSRYLSIFVLATQDNVQEKKSKSVAFNNNLESQFVKTIFSTTMMLNYELGVLNAKDIY